MNETYRSYALSSLMVAAVWATAFVPVVPPGLRPYLEAVSTALTGTATLFHVVIPKLGDQNGPSTRSGLGGPPGS